MKNLIYLLFIAVISFSSCKKDNLLNQGKTINVTEDITSNETWISENTYIIEGSVDINSNAVLTIEAGSTVKFESGAEITVAYSNGFGAIRAIGTTQNPILFTSNSSIKQVGNWNSIFLYSGASGSNFEYCNFEYGGGYSELYGMVYMEECEVGFLNCSFTNSASYGLSLDDDASLSTFDNNIFNNCYRNPLLIYAKYLHNIGTGNSFAPTSDILVLYDKIDIPGSFTWKNQGVPYNFRGSFKIGSSSGTTIIIEPGTKINLSSDSEILIAYDPGTFGVIKVNGTTNQPISIESSSPFPAAGDWYGIWFYDGTGAGTSFEHCNISYGGGYGYGGNLAFYDDVAANVSVSNSTISYSDQYGIYRHNASYDLPALNNVTFVSNTLGDNN